MPARRYPPHPEIRRQRIETDGEPTSAPGPLVRRFVMAAMVLVVDDSRGVRDAVRMVLEGEGYEVATAANGAEALERIEAEAQPDVMLLDLQMPVMDGWEVQR